MADEALRTRCDLLVAYHPPIFKGLHAIVPDASGPTARLPDLLRAGVSVIALHTALDAAAGGTNDVLLDCFELAERRPLEPLAHARLVTALLFRHYPAPWDGAERAARNVRDRVVGPCARCGHAKADHVYHVCWGGDVAGGCECRGFEAGASLR